MSQYGEKVFIFFAVTVWQATCLAEDWPTWRGPSGNGISSKTDVPTSWDEESNIRWKVPLPGGSNSSPVVHSGRVFVTAPDEDGSLRRLVAFDRRNGERLWQQTVTFEGRESRHSTNPPCSASPVTDGEVVCASFGSAGLIACILDGQRLWHKDLGRFDHVFGNASSPILYRNLCILWCGPGPRQFVVAVDKQSGREVWRHDVPGGKRDFDAPSDCVGSWATPLLASVEEQNRLISNAQEWLICLDPKNGKRLWVSRGPGKLAYASLVAWKGTVVAMSGYHGPIVAVKATGRGDVTKTHRVWQRVDRQPQRIGTGLVLEGKLYCVTEIGVAECFDIETGRLLDKSRSRLTGQTWSSLVYADGNFYLSSLGGVTTVFAAEGGYKVLSRNRLRDRIAASPAISDGEIFLRGHANLYCIGTP